MKQRNKFIIAGVALIGTVGLLASFTNSNEDEKNKKYQIIHHADGKVIEYDTIIPMSSSYSVEDFLADKGIESENVEIINMPSIGKHKMMFIDEDGTHTEISDSHVMHTDFEFEGDHEGKQVKIIAEMDENGNMVTKKFVDGEEVEMTDIDLHELKIHEKMDGDDNIVIKMEIDGDSEHEMNFSHEGKDGETVKIICEMDDDGKMTTKKFINGEEVELTKEELEKIKSHSDIGENHMVIKLDSDELGEIDIEEIMKELKSELKNLDIELDHLGDEINIDIEKILSEVHMSTNEDGEHKVIVKKMEHHGGADGEHKFIMDSESGEDFTIVLVTENYDENAADIERNIEKSISREIDDVDMSFYPNPNDGTFTIELNQTEKMKTNLKIVDSQGKVVFKDNLGKFSGKYKKEVNLKEGGTGTYILTVQRGDQLSTEKIIIK